MFGCLALKMPKPIPQVADKPPPDLAEGATASAPREVSWMTGKLHEMFGYGSIGVEGTGHAFCRHRGWPFHFVGDRTSGFRGEV